MHFRAELTVELATPELIEEADGTTEVLGYIVIVGVNAPDAATAACYAQKAALRPKEPDGTFREFAGSVVEVKLERIEKSGWDPLIQEQAKRIDEEGVYYSTGLVFFGPEE